MNWKSLIDKALGTDFDKAQPDPAKDRKKLIAVIEKAESQYGSTDPIPPQRSWKVGHNKAVRFIPKINGQVVRIEGHDALYIPAERFPDFLKGLKESVKAGELDKEIKAALEGKKSSAVAKPPRAPRVSTGLGSRAQPDNPEWMAKFVEKVGPAPGDGYVPNSKGTKWVSAANAARGQSAAKARFG